MVLKRLENPTDIDSWSLLRDALDLVDVTPECESDLRERLVEFLSDSAAEAYGIAEEDDEEAEDIDFRISELGELEMLGEQWGVEVDEISALIEELEQIQDRRDEGEEEQIRQERLSNQPTLFDVDNDADGGNGIIFDQF